MGSRLHPLYGIGGFSWTELCYEQDLSKLHGLRNMFFDAFSYTPPQPGLFLAARLEFLERGKWFQTFFPKVCPWTNYFSTFFTSLLHRSGPLVGSYVVNRVLINRFVIRLGLRHPRKKERKVSMLGVTNPVLVTRVNKTNQHWLLTLSISYRFAVGIVGP